MFSPVTSSTLIIWYIKVGMSLSSKYFTSGIFDPRGYIVIPSLSIIPLSLNLRKAVLLFVSYMFNISKSYLFFCDRSVY